MNLNELEVAHADEGSVLKLRHPKTEEVIEGMTITLLGTDSAVYREIMRNRQQAALDRASKGRNARRLDVAQAEANALDDLVKLTVAWTGGPGKATMSFGTEELECTPENVRKVYSHPKLRWIRDQADEFYSDRANFF